MSTELHATSLANEAAPEYEISPEAQEALAGIVASNMRAAFAVPEVFAGILEENRTLNEQPVDPGSVDADIVRECVTLADGSMCYVFAPAGDEYNVGSSLSDTVLLFYHGGGFFLQPTEPHWAFCQELARTLQARVVFPIYPLLPIHGGEELLTSARAAYEFALSLSPAQRVVTMGDSAGGYLSLLMMPLALESDMPTPRGIVALSPMIDFGFEVPARADGEDNDPMLGRHGLDEAMRMLFPDAAETHAFPPCILHGPFDKTCELLVTVGSREVMKGEIEAYVACAREAGLHVDFYVEAGLWHNYILRDTLPEAQRMRATLYDFLRQLF